MRNFIIFFIIISQFLCKAFCTPISINTDFFKKFNDEYLIEYIYKALEDNHDIKQLNKKIEQYRLDVQNAFSMELPQLSVSGNYLGAHFPKGDPNFLIKENSYIMPFKSNFEPDLLLKNRDKTKSKKQLYLAELANQKSSYISLITDIASAYINILLSDYLIKIQKEILENKRISLEGNKAKYELGLIDLIEYNNSKNELKTQTIAYDNLIKNQKTILFNFCTLIGESPENYKDIRRGKIENFEYQDKIPEEICSDVIYKRPDLIEIENKLKSARIDVRIAKKEFFPSFNINAFMVFDTAGTGNFFTWNSSFAILLAGVTQDIFMGGRKIVNLKIKKAKYEELFEKYKQADLIAIKEINSALNVIKCSHLTEKNTKEQLDLEKINYIRSKEKLKVGTICKIDLLSDKEKLFQREQIFIASKALKLINYITLYKVVGGEL